MARLRREKRDYSHLYQTPAPEVLEKAIQNCSFKGGPRWEHYVNKDLITLFGELQTVSLTDVVERYLDMLAATRNTMREKPTAFNHSRAGNLIGWGLRLSLLEEVLDETGVRAWRLVERELRWDVHNGRARQIRGLPDGEQAAMDRKLATGRKRAETAARKYAAKIAPELKSDIDLILRYDPEAVLDDKFSEFLKPWFTPPLAVHAAYGALLELHHGWPKEKQQHWKRAIARELTPAYFRGEHRRKTQRAEAEAMSDDDAAALGDLI
ncbi:hypothetical protein [Microvirga arabica]|uniref:hypothetical protein n=1 Tax=Microvirga arabica TaxID=1128671 RepID=UPI00193932C8|nr:hypothetical protein [Microvirga arabica]MBM1170090.1 hypothetical protein [Microvirga arabica]